MDPRVSGRIIASCFGLCGFAIALLASLGADTTPETALLRSIVSLVVCYIVGAAVGAVAERCVREHLDKYMREHPVPRSAVPGTGDEDVIELEPVG